MEIPVHRPYIARTSAPTRCHEPPPLHGAERVTNKELTYEGGESTSHTVVAPPRLFDRRVVGIVAFVFGAGGYG